MRRLKAVLILLGVVVLVVSIWLGLLYRTYGLQTLLFLFRAPPEFILTYSKNMVVSPDTSPIAGIQSPTPRIAIPTSHRITTMSHAYQKLNNCGPTSASMAASTLGVTFDQFVAADVMKGSYTDKNVSPEEILAYLPTQGLKAIYRVNGNNLILEEFIAQDIPVIAEQWLVKRGSGELVGHYRVMRAYDQDKKIFTTNDSFNGPNFVIPYAQFDEWWRPFNRGYIVVYKPEQEAIVKNILGPDWNEAQNWMTALETAQAETKSIGDGYASFNVGTNATLLHNYELAGSAYDNALSTTFPPDFLWYQFGYFEAYYQLGQYDRVLELTNDLLSHAGEVEEARYYRGLAFAKQGKTAEAKAEFEKALRANPRYAKAATALKQLQ